MAKRTRLKKNPAKKKAKPELDPLQQEILSRLSDVDAVLSPFWSARSYHSPR